MSLSQKQPGFSIEAASAHCNRLEEERLDEERIEEEKVEVGSCYL